MRYDDNFEAERNLLLLGNGGHCNSVLDSVLSSGKYNRIGIVEKADCTNLDKPYVVGTDENLMDLFNDGWDSAFITIGSIGDTHIREEKYALLKRIGFLVPAIIDPTAIVSKKTIIGEGVYIGKKTVINAGSNIGKCAIVNTGTIIEHDCRIGDFCHVSPGSVLCGGVTVNHCSHIGAGTIIRQELSVGHHSLIGIGSIVVSSIPDYVVAYGNPCRIKGKE